MILKRISLNLVIRSSRHKIKHSTVLQGCMRGRLFSASKPGATTLRHFYCYFFSTFTPELYSNAFVEGFSLICQLLALSLTFPFGKMKIYLPSSRSAPSDPSAPCLWIRLCLLVSTCWSWKPLWNHSVYNWGGWAAPMAHRESCGEGEVPAPRLVWVISKRERIKICQLRVKWAWYWLWEERGGDSQRGDTHWKPAGGAGTSSQVRDVGYGELEVGQQHDVVGLHGD